MSRNPFRGIRGGSESLHDRADFDARQSAHDEHDEALAAVVELRRRVSEGTVNADALAVAEYRLAMASKRLTRQVTTPFDDLPPAA